MATPAVKCTIELEFPSEETAQRVHKSVELDNAGFVRSEVRQNVIWAEADASSLKSLIHTLDDFLSCISVAESIVRSGQS